MKQLTLMIISLFLGGLIGARAQTASSFYTVQSLTDVNFTFDNTTLTMNVSLGNNPNVQFNNFLYKIEKLFGVFVISDNGGLTASATSQNEWSFKTNPVGDSEISGWRNPSMKFSIEPNESLSFSMDQININKIDDYGFHVMVNTPLPFGGDAFFLRKKVVPEPATLSVIGLGLAGIALRFRKK